MITVHAIRLETGPALLLLKDGAETAGVINNRTDVEILLAAIYAGAEVLWPEGGWVTTAEPVKAPPRAWACRQGDDCRCEAERVEPGGCGNYQGTWGIDSEAF